MLLMDSCCKKAITAFYVTCLPTWKNDSSVFELPQLMLVGFFLFFYDSGFLNNTHLQLLYRHSCKTIYTELLDTLDFQIKFPL